MTSGGLNEMMSASIFDMGPTEEGLAKKAQNRKWRAVEERAGTASGFRYVELPMLAMFGESDFNPVKLPSTRNVKSAG